MKINTPPPSWRHVFDEMPPERLVHLLLQADLADDPDYRIWEWYRHHTPPQGVTSEQWWALVRRKREESARETPFRMRDGLPFTYNLPDALLRCVETITSRASGEIAMPEQGMDARLRNRYLLASLREEAITSSQLEGASTSRRDAQKMLRENRAPQTRSEQMILNNFRVMQWIIGLRDQELTPELVAEIHRRITEGTLDEPESAGKLQGIHEERVRIYGSDSDEQVLHIPPPAQELPERLQKLCDFANARDGGVGAYLPPLLRCMTLHFMVGYDHYFVDGNGRTARAIFYWSMLREGFHLTEFLSISRLLRAAPAQYARSFLDVEHDGGDLTHFFLSQTEVIIRAIDDLEEYLAHKMRELGEARTQLRGLELNYRQILVLERLMKHSGAEITVASHRDECRISTQTARTDLQQLETKGYVQSEVVGRKMVWFAAPDLVDRVRNRGEVLC